ncbi:UvrD-helicase domain-containing protein [Pseudomonas kilonensis]|uniref:UvrD-helicase domain-containing protein n=1 Tax=Pseudomonas kilonensis TaxID=132476 RepID=UPI00209DC502|nr:superfamily I DNA/RNA helicase [Pseudomonas kilonensis]
MIRLLLEKLYCSTFRGLNFILNATFPTASKTHRKELYDSGYKKGKEDGVLEGKQIWEIRDSRTPKTKPIDHTVYGPDEISITTANCIAMRKWVDKAVTAGLISMPSDEQWPMILSSNPSTRIFAGAGSGKSTTLVLRVIFMICHLDIPKNHITVISFTRDSCDELREKIAKVIAFWGKLLSANDLKSIVRTYHSVLYNLSKQMFPGAVWFENISKPDSELADIDNPLTSSKLNDEQIEILKKTYHSAYTKSAQFRKDINELLKIETDSFISKPTSSEVEKIKNFALLQAKIRDFELSTQINSLWELKGIWPIEGVEPGPFPCFSIDGEKFYANGIITSTREYLFLGGVGTKEFSVIDENLELSGENFKTTNLGVAVGVKRKLINAHCNKNVYYINSARELSNFSKIVNFIKPNDETLKDAPIFNIKLQGELSDKNIYEAIFTQASFIENIGLDVMEACEKFEFKTKKEHHFSNALCLFWKQLYMELSDNRNMLTYNRGFQLATQALEDENYVFTADQLKPYRHLLVDEFQDISPQIVKFLAAIQKRITLQSKVVSIMAIGDDWQSIYGWRGSSPGLFLDFDKYFVPHPKLGGSNILCLGTNYRSIKPIVQDASIVLAKVKYKAEKPVTAFQNGKKDGHGLKLNLEFDLKKNAKKIIEEINNQIVYCNSLSKPDKNKIIVISRSNEALTTIENECNSEQKKSLVFHTIHGSKGLQGEVAIIVGDCLVPDSHPFRNMAYKTSGFFLNSYDEAMYDETMRLAYVAITRGVSRVLWFSQRTEGATKIINEKLRLSVSS